MLRRVDVRAGVGDRRDGVVAPALAVGQVLDRATEDRRDELRRSPRGPGAPRPGGSARPGCPRARPRGRRSASRRSEVGEVLGAGARAARRGSSAARPGVATAEAAEQLLLARERVGPGDRPSARRGARTGTRPRAARRPRARAASRPATAAYCARVWRASARRAARARRRRRCGTSALRRAQRLGPAAAAALAHQVAAAACSSWRAHVAGQRVGVAGPGGGRLERRELAHRRARLLGVLVERGVGDARRALAARLRVERVEAVADAARGGRTRATAPIRPGAWPGRWTTSKPATSSPSCDRAGDLDRAAVPRRQQARHEPARRRVEALECRSSASPPSPSASACSSAWQRPARRGPARRRGGRRARGRARRA